MFFPHSLLLTMLSVCEMTWFIYEHTYTTVYNGHKIKQYRAMLTQKAMFVIGQASHTADTKISPAAQGFVLLGLDGQNHTFCTPFCCSCTLVTDLYKLSIGSPKPSLHKIHGMKKLHSALIAMQAKSELYC